MRHKDDFRYYLEKGIVIGPIPNKEDVVPIFEMLKKEFGLIWRNSGRELSDKGASFWNRTDTNPFHISISEYGILFSFESDFPDQRNEGAIPMSLEKVITTYLDDKVSIKKEIVSISSMVVPIDYYQPPCPKCGRKMKVLFLSEYYCPECG